jgi:hypothetical protein
MIYHKLDRWFMKTETKLASRVKLIKKPEVFLKNREKPLAFVFHLHKRPLSYVKRLRNIRDT